MLRMLALTPLEREDSRLSAACALLALKVAAVITFVGAHFFRSRLRAFAFSWYVDVLERHFRQRHFLGLSAVHMQAQW